MSIKVSSSAAIAALLLLWSGCTTAPTRPLGNPAISRLMEKDLVTIDESFVTQVMAEGGARKSVAQQKVKTEIQRKVNWWLHYDTVRDRERFSRNLLRGETYRTLVQQILWQENLPPELYYLGLIESGYVMHATSTTEAVGIWQFMRPTAQTFGLSVDPKWDERTHPIAATYAAAKYLIKLHKRFNSWYLAIAAYNAGEGRIRSAVASGHSQDFWNLAAHGYIPRETMDYIPKFLAAATIGANLDKFGFEMHPSKEIWPEVVPVRIKVGTAFADIVKRSALSESELLRFNPQLRKATTPRCGMKLRIWVPRSCAERFLPRRKSTFAVRDKKRS